ncbi:MAG: hypothetical protein AAGI89_09125 [Pseudomonadota bacterium]
MTDQPTSLDEDAIRRLIEATVSAAGETDPSELPHQVRRKLAGQATGAVDLEATIADVLRGIKKNAPGSS